MIDFSALNVVVNTFDIYAGVFYKAIHEFERDSGILLGLGDTYLCDAPPKYPSTNQCHWWTNLGQNPGGGPIRSWKIGGEEDVEHTAKEVISVLEARAIPMLARYSDSAQLVEIWKSTEPTWINVNFGEFMRMKYLAVFLADTRRLNDLEQILMELWVLFGKTEASRHVKDFVSKIRAFSQSRP